MTDSLQFETPENIRVQYQPAGLGTRYLAWFVDQILLAVILFLVLIAMAVAGISLSVFDGFVERVEDPEVSPEHLGIYVIGIIALVMGLGSFFYFTLFELLMLGQTPGKRMTMLRVAKVDGFALDAGSILVRNIFRVADNIPLLWIVPLLSVRHQRTGDMVAGTVLISDAPPQMSEVRSQLADRTAAEAEFRFEGKVLQRLSETDLEAVEKLLDRWHAMPGFQREPLAKKLVDALTSKLQVAAPPTERHVRFLEDLLSAELRRQRRGLN